MIIDVVERYEHNEPSQLDKPYELFAYIVSVRYAEIVFADEDRIGGMDKKLLERIVVDPEVMTGKPVMRGTRIPVELIVRMLAQGLPEETILKEYPRLEHEDIRAALTYASQVLAHEDVFPLATSG